MYNLLNKSRKNETGKTYEKLFKALRKVLPKHYSFQEVNDVIESLHRKQVEEPKLLDAGVFLNALLKGKPEEVTYRVRSKLHILRRVSHHKEQVAEILIKRSEEKKERLRIGKVRNIDIQLDRLFRDKIYVSKQQTIPETVKSLLLVTLLNMQLTDQIDERFLNSVDFTSLIRLSMSCGGEKFTVPTYTEVELILASTYFFYLRQYEGLSNEAAAKRVAKDLQVDLDLKQLCEYYNSLALLYSKEMRRDSTPIMKVLEKLTNLIQDLQTRLGEAVTNINTSEEFLRTYKDVNKAFMTLSRGLNKL